LAGQPSRQLSGYTGRDVAKPARAPQRKSLIRQCALLSELLFLAA
jgi:hypothetical protein